MLIENFGKNVNFRPKHYYEPKTENEVLGILNRHRLGQIRVTGGGHAWSHAIESMDAFLDLKYLDSIQIKKENGKSYVEVGGGCKLEHLVLTLTKQNLIIPAMGGIMQQTVAGLASTATHGTGRASFSHYIAAIRIAAYDTDGQAKIFEYKEADELLAGRTAIGCMGVIVSMKIHCVERYYLKENMVTVDTFDQALDSEKEWPLQQFAVIPHAWKFLMFKRHIVASGYDKLKSALLRFRDIIFIEWLPHAMLKTILLFRNDNFVINYYKFLPKTLTEVTTINEDYKGLTLHTRRHYRFRHVEMEVFIPEQYIKQAYATIHEIVDWFAGTSENLSTDLQNRLEKTGLLQEMKNSKGSYTLHYTMFFRKILPDESLIGMTSGNQNYYAVGFFTYHKEADRKGYYHFAETMAKILNRLYDARLHWGKHFPLAHGDIARLYPEMEKFKSICKQVDPNGVFQNKFTKEVFGN